MAINKQQAEIWATHIREAARNVAPGMYVNSELRLAFESYAVACGMRTSLVGRASDTDLISVYLVGRRDLVAAARTARKVEERLAGFAPAGGPLEPLPEPPAPVPAPQPEPTPRVSEEKLNALRDLIRGELRTAMETVETTLDQRDAETAAKLTRLEDQVSNVVAGLLEKVEAVAEAKAIEALKSRTPTELVITRDDAPKVDLGIVHFRTPLIIAALEAGSHVYLHGPAGSGKTTVAAKCAQAFGLKLYTAAKVESEYQLLGFKDARGETVRTQFRDAYEHGGLFLFDELDGSSPSAVVALNMALANGSCPFPDGTIPQHPDFKCLGAGNTKLSGASRQYTGRNQLDAASVDRFEFIEFGYDEELERTIAPNPQWTAYVQRVRAEVAVRGINHLVTPRASLRGAKLLAKGLDWDTVASMCVYKGLDTHTVDQIKRAVTGA